VPSDYREVVCWGSFDILSFIAKVFEHCVCVCVYVCDTEIYSYIFILLRFVCSIHLPINYLFFWCLTFQFIVYFGY
jgi:hypothetical protein